MIADRLEDLSDLLRSVAGRDGAGRDGAGPDGHAAWDIGAPDDRPSGIKVPTRDFR